MTLKLSLSRPTTVPVELNYKVTGGSATPGSDFHPAEGLLAIPAGVTEASLTVEIIGDEDVEPDETFTVELKKPANATLARARATVTIRNDDKGPPLPRISIEPVSLPEGNTGKTPFKFPLTLSAAAAKPVSVGYTTLDHTAHAGEDFQAAAGTVTFPAGSTTATLVVAVGGDTRWEPDEVFEVRLSAPVGARLRARWPSA